MLKFTKTDAHNIDYQALIKSLDQYLSIVDGHDHAFYSQYNKSTHIKNVIVAYLDDKPVGCGAFKIYESETVEIKRMFVSEEYRGQGIATQILSYLEQWAGEFGYRACILETGKRQPDAIHLYQTRGYEIIPNYGQYIGVEYSLCMKKVLI